MCTRPPPLLVIPTALSGAKHLDVGFPHGRPTAGRGPWHPRHAMRFQVIFTNVGTTAVPLSAH